MFRIGKFSKLAKTTVKTLRYYDKVGLLKPAFVDSRRYTKQRYIRYTEKRQCRRNSICKTRTA